MLRQMLADRTPGNKSIPVAMRLLGVKRSSKKIHKCRACYNVRADVQKEGVREEISYGDDRHLEINDTLSLYKSEKDHSLHSF